MEKRRARCADGQDCTAILACCAWLDLAAVGVDEVLGTIANAEDGNVFAYAREIDGGRALLTDGRGAAGEDYASDGAVDFRAFVEGVYFAVDVLLADTAAD